MDFCSEELTRESFIYACTSLLDEGGCCAIMPTVITSPMAAYAKVLPIIAAVIEDSPISDRLLGIHLEGPFISPVPGAIGCHRTECVVASDLRMLKELHSLARGKVKLLTMAAEWPDSPEVCEWAVS